MFNFSSEYFLKLLYSLPGILIAISFHEMAHAYAADAMGDPTPKNAGRLTINPLKHLDFIGLISMMLFRFGWAKPVPINPNNFRNHKKGIIIVGLSGILTNLLLGFIGVAAYYAIIPLNNDILESIMQAIYSYNIVFAVFNIIPIPPLDGSRVLAELLPYKAKQKYLSFERYGMIVLLVLIILGAFSYIISPVANLILKGYSAVLTPLFNLIWG